MRGKRKNKKSSTKHRRRQAAYNAVADIPLGEVAGDEPAAAVPVATSIEKCPMCGSTDAACPIDSGCTYRISATGKRKRKPSGRQARANKSMDMEADLLRLPGATQQAPGEGDDEVSPAERERRVVALQRQRNATKRHLQDEALAQAAFREPWLATSIGNNVNEDGTLASYGLVGHSPDASGECWCVALLLACRPAAAHSKRCMPLPRAAHVVVDPTRGWATTAKKGSMARAEERAKRAADKAAQAAKAEEEETKMFAGEHGPHGAIRRAHCPPPPSPPPPTTHLQLSPLRGASRAGKACPRSFASWTRFRRTCRRCS